MNIVVKRINRQVQVVRVGKRGLQGETGPQGPKGDQGDPATNLVQSVNGKQGVVVLNATDVNADPTGSAAQALQDAKDYTDNEVSTLDSSLATVAKTGSYNDLSNKPTIPSIAGLATEAQVQDVQDNLDAHEADTANPHAVTKAQVGLSNVDNLAPADMPVSTATQTALNAKANASDTVNLTGNQTVAGVKTFSSSPVVPTATTNTQAVNKGQMDTADALKVNKAGDTMTGVLVNTVAGLPFQHNRSGAGNISWGVGSSGRFIVYENGSGAFQFQASGSGIYLGDDSKPRVLHGTGFPNGVVSAPVGSIYIDTAVTNGASSWIKKSGTGNTGWSVLEGDTGWRNLSSVLQNGWAGSIYLRRIGSVAYLSAGRYSFTGASATSDTFYTLPSGFRSSGYGNFSFIGVAGVGSAVPTMALISITRHTYLLGCSARNEVAGDWSYLTQNDWPATLPGVSA